MGLDIYAYNKCKYAKPYEEDYNENLYAYIYRNKGFKHSMNKQKKMVYIGLKKNIILRRGVMADITDGEIL